MTPFGEFFLGYSLSILARPQRNPVDMATRSVGVELVSRRSVYSLPEYHVAVSVLTEGYHLVGTTLNLDTQMCLVRGTRWGVGN